MTRREGDDVVPVRPTDYWRGRLLDILIGLALGGLATGSASMTLVGQRLATLEAQVQGLRHDVDLMQRKLP